VNEKPSIAELQREMLPLVRHADWIGQAAWEDARDSLVDAAPVLLEIAAAALAWSGARTHAESSAASGVLLNAIAKVRP